MVCVASLLHFSLSPSLSLPSLLPFPESPPLYPDLDDEEGWGANEFEGSDDEEAEPNATGTLQFLSDNSTEQQCMLIAVLCVSMS